MTALSVIIDIVFILISIVLIVVVHQSMEWSMKSEQARELVETAEVDGVPQQEGVRTLAVAPSAPGLLEVGLRAVGDVVVGDKTNVGLVYAHPEGVGRDHHPRPSLLPVVLLAGTGLRPESGMVEVGAYSFGTEEGGYLLGQAPAADIDDARPGDSAAEG